MRHLGGVPGLVNGPDSLKLERFREAGSTGQNVQGLASIIYMFSFKFWWPQRISGGPQSVLGRLIERVGNPLWIGILEFKASSPHLYGRAHLSWFFLQ